MNKFDVGYQEQSHPNTVKQYCRLTIGSIIMFNGKKCIVTHTNCGGNRSYKRVNKATKDITAGSSGMLKHILTSKEFNANWSTLTSDKIIYYEA